MASWRWDEAAARYRDQVTGRFLSRNAVEGYVLDSLAAASKYSEGLASVLGDTKIMAGGWYSAMRQEIKEEYIRQYLVGIGGREQMTQADWGSIGGMLTEQYKYFEGFYNEVIQGNLSPEQIAARSNMYLNSAREAFERAQAKLSKSKGFDEERWLIDTGAENCEDCLAFAGLGWQSIVDDPYGGAIPGSGDTKCLTACKCTIEYRKSDTDEVFWDEE